MISKTLESTTDLVFYMWIYDLELKKESCFLLVTFKTVKQMYL